MAVATAMRVPYAYLDREFTDIEPYLNDIRALVKTGDFTLGYPVREFEGRVVAFTGVPYAVGMANGTEALTLPLRALGIGHGDEVITATNSFVASAGAIAMAGATPALADCLDDFTIDPDAIERAITPKTRAIVPVHLTGQMADMPRIMQIARQHNLAVIEDAAQAMGATFNGRHAGVWGDAAGISMHPLKMMNVWGDGGITVTCSPAMDHHLRLLRNHGLETRDNSACFGGNGRLSSLQAVIANRVMAGLSSVIARRRALAADLAQRFADLAPRVRAPITREGVEPVWMTYILRVEKRDALLSYLLARGIDAKVHYPVPLHLQTVGRVLGYAPGDCPTAERLAGEIITLPFNEYLTDDEVAYMVDTIHGFYR